MEKYTYSIPTDSSGNPSETVIVRSDGVWIPADPANSDYQAYLNPKAEQSTPMVTDEADSL